VTVQDAFDAPDCDFSAEECLCSRSIISLDFEQWCAGYHVLAAAGAELVQLVCCDANAASPYSECIRPLRNSETSASVKGSPLFSYGSAPIAAKT
jgi:hypothetical protein